MMKFNPVPPSFRSLRAAAVLALVISHWVLVIPSVAAAPALAVAVVQPTRVADLVMINGGFDAGLRQGMVCRVTRGTTEVAEILLVEVRPTCSAALITSLAPKQSIRAGDAAALKILKT
jgi:hypothetical protein